MARIPDTPIYCTANAIDSINGHHHHPEWNFKVVKTGDTLDIGNGKQLIFVETPMLHWPDSMMTPAAMTGDAGVYSATTPLVSTTATSACSMMKWTKPNCLNNASATTPIS